MRFQIKFKPTPKEGDNRTITTYCIFPRIVGDTIYWLEKIKILQVYSTPTWDLEGHCWDWECWDNIRVIDSVKD